jgi:hypothetical protein
MAAVVAPTLDTDLSPLDDARAIMDIVVWLRSLGLGKYEAALRENDIDETVLPGLTHETLKELGVVSVGHRVKLLDAIAVSVTPRAESRLPLTQGPHQLPQTRIQKTVPNAAKSR